jgi:hypothetical protein
LFSALTEHHPMLFQGMMLMCILLALFAILKLPHGGAVWRVLGWTMPSGRYLVTASLGGLPLAIIVTLSIHAKNTRVPAIVTWKLAVLATTLGPILEESFFSRLPASPHRVLIA